MGTRWPHKIEHVSVSIYNALYSVFHVNDFNQPQIETIEHSAMQTPFLFHGKSCVG